ncbi:MAG: double zinc ribbon domain-containing protein [Promethearchaeota archaeon]
MSLRDYNRKSFSVLAGFLACLALLFFIIGLFLELSIILMTIFPILLFILLGLLIYRYTGESKKSCPRCNFPISIYTEYCRNCGLKLINKCPNCNIYTDGKLNYCDNCGYEFPTYEGEKLPFEYKVYEEGDQVPEKPNFCPTCGASLKNVENLRFCEFCGSKIS